MRTLSIITIILIGTSLKAFSFGLQDSVKVDKKKIEKVIKAIKKRPEIKNAKRWDKDFDKSKMTFVYPKQFVSRKGFTIEVLYKGQVILSYNIEPDTYEFGEIFDWR